MSYHTAIFGVTGSGKSYLAQQFAAAIRRRRRPVVVFNPLRDGSWSGCCDMETDDAARFLRLASANRGCALFVEECGLIDRKLSDAFRRLLTTGRHAGHRLYILGQRAEQVPPIVRDSCAYLYLFRSSLAGAKFWAGGFDAALLDAPRLPPRQFFFCAPCEPCRLLTLRGGRLVTPD